MATDPRIAELDKKLAQLKARREKLALAETSQLRKLENKQKIILGGWLLQNDKAMVELIKERLTRTQDRKAFDLPPLPSPPSSSESPELPTEPLSEPAETHSPEPANPS